MSKSFHHRMAKLNFEGDWRPKCQARDCKMAVEYACEWAMMRKGRPVTAARIYCRNHAQRFAENHNIDITQAPVILLANIEKSERDNWAFAKRE